MQCPGCRADLHDVANRTGRAAACSACGGIWLDNVTSRSIVQNLLEPAVKNAAQQADAMAAQNAESAQAQGSGYRAPAPRPPDEAARLCPECGAPLAQTKFAAARILLDVCAAHGTWFDSRELATMAQHFEAKAAADDADAIAFGRRVQADRNEDTISDLQVLLDYFRR
jgi:Zn-finger nucleic acid-binding protein